jgi:23S rRNA (guanosine2251-2'-O)-methyltransferase
MTKENCICGIRPVIEALKAGKEIDRILIQAGLKGEGIRQLQHLIKELGIAFQFVPIDKLNRLSRQNHQGVVAFISEITYTKSNRLSHSYMNREKFLFCSLLTGSPMSGTLGPSHAPRSVPAPMLF